MADSLRDLGQTVVLTSGSFDILHEGHSLYLEAAREAGDFLIVGVDSDEKVRARKGPSRPAVPEEERLRMVTHQRGVGLVTLKPVGRVAVGAHQGGASGRARRDGRDLHARRGRASSRAPTAAGCRSCRGWPRSRRPRGCGCSS